MTYCSIYNYLHGTKVGYTYQENDDCIFIYIEDETDDTSIRASVPDWDAVSNWVDSAVYLIEAA